MPRKRVAVYAGSFDPPTLGHLDVISRVHGLFDELHVLVAHNVRKATMFSDQERVELLRQAVAAELSGAHVKVATHNGLVVDYCRKHGARVLVRGLRAMSDFENELQIASMNRRLAPEIETMHVMTDERFFFVSSSLIKELAHYNGELSPFVPAVVEKALRKKKKRGKK